VVPGAAFYFTAEKLLAQYKIRFRFISVPGFLRVLPDFLTSRTKLPPLKISPGRDWHF
jgi:hypothetical protein